MSTHSTLATEGVLILSPGRAQANIAGQRSALAQRLLGGRPAAEAPQLLSRLYTLCARAHGLTASLAIDAALGQRVTPSMTERAGFAVETAREHVRRIWMDWPRLLGRQADGKNGMQGGMQGDGEVAAILAECPLFRFGASLDRMPSTMVGWLESYLLRQSAYAWLAHWDADPDDCLRLWCARSTTLPARLMRSVCEPARALHALGPWLLPHRQPDAMRELALAALGDAQFSARPRWHGKPCETGVWSRLALQGRSAMAVDNAWLRLGARIAELVRLSLVGGDGPGLAIGAMMVAPGQAIAWSEMARGLLLHVVQLAQAGDDGATLPRIERYSVVAPTEWNFHADGTVARALAAMPRAHTAEQCNLVAQQVAILAAAFDPCIHYRIEFDDA